MRALLFPVVVLIAASCGTPDVAEDYRAKTLLPAEIEAALRSDNPTRRAEAAEQIGKLPPEERIEVELELSRDPEPSVRLLAAKLLARDSADPRAVERLAEMLGLDGDADVRSVALSGLADSGSLAALAAIVEALEADSSLIVRRQAAAALDRLTGQELGAAFVSSLDEAEMSADGAAAGYSDWFEARGKDLRWDAGSSRFVRADEEANR